MAQMETPDPIDPDARRARHGEEARIDSAEPPSDVSMDDVTLRRVDASERAVVLDKIMELERIVYEPARQDTREHLSMAFDEGGIVIVAEAHGRIVGSALGGPLENYTHVQGPDLDVMQGQKNTLYAMATTVDPSMRGRGLGRRLKSRLVHEASGDYSYVSGRIKMGFADAMMHINRSLGAYEVSRFDQAYDDGGTCLYYRLPLDS